MIHGLLLLAIAAVVASCSSYFATVGRPNAADLEAQRSPAEEISFEADVLPILSAGCRPCHFEGGKMYEKLPFDRPETIRTLGERLSTRIKDKREREVVRAFLARAQ